MLKKALFQKQYVVSANFSANGYKIDGNILLNAQKEYVGNIEKSGKTTENTNVNISIVKTG